MDIKEFDEKYYFHDSLVNSIAYDDKDKTVTIMFDFCYWMQQGFEKGEQENGLLKVIFKNVEEFDGIQGTDKGDWWSVLDGDIKDGKYHLLIEDMERGGVENPEYHDIYIKSDDVEVEDLR